MMASVDKWIKINRYYSSWRIGALLVALFIISQSSLQAQEKDFVSWTNAGFEYKLKPAFAISGNLEWRTKDDLSKTDRWGLGVGGKYSLLPFLKLGMGYELHYRNRGSNGWKFRHRYYVDGTLSARLQSLKFSLRERVQHTFDGNNDEFRLRSRFKMAYNLSKIGIEPYVSLEMYNSLNQGEHFDVDRMRYRGGIALPLSARWNADVFYCRQWEQGDRKNIVGLECIYTF